MSGTDTARGMNFQYACAIGMLLAFPEQPEWHTIQFEGDVDIDDALILDAQGRIRLRAQIKQKVDPYRWESHELDELLTTFAETTDSEATQYQFLYCGSEGPSFHKLKSTLLEVEHSPTPVTAESAHTLGTHLGDLSLEFLQRVRDRFRLVKRGSWQDIQDSDLRRLRKLLRASNKMNV